MTSVRADSGILAEQLVRAGCRAIAAAGALDEESRLGHGYTQCGRRRPTRVTIRCRRPSRSPAAPREASLGLKLLGGLAVRVLCPEFPPRLRAGQDIDFACVTKERKKVADYLAEGRLRARPPVQQPQRRPPDVLQRPVGPPHRRHGRPADHVPHAGLPVRVLPPAVHDRRRRRAAVQAADRRAQREGRCTTSSICWPGSRSAGAAGPASTPTASPSCSGRTGAGGGR